MSSESLAVDWGNWVLGDVPHILQLACVAVGHATEVVRATVELPRGEREFALPEVSLVLSDRVAVERLRHALLSDGYVMAPDRAAGDEGSAVGRWRAVLPGFDLRVEAAIEAPR